MVNISKKAVTKRVARAQCVVWVPAEVAELMKDGEIQSPKGPVIATAIVAGTMAVKRTSDLIPFCHPLPVDGCDIRIALRSQKEVAGHCAALASEQANTEVGKTASATSVSQCSLPMFKNCPPCDPPSGGPYPYALHVVCEVHVTHKTGVEMEALVAANVTALTLYDMCKAVTHDMVITNSRLLSKSGGKRDMSL